MPGEHCKFLTALKSGTTRYVDLLKIINHIDWSNRVITAPDIWSCIFWFCIFQSTQDYVRRVIVPHARSCSSLRWLRRRWCRTISSQVIIRVSSPSRRPPANTRVPNAFGTSRDSTAWKPIKLPCPAGYLHRSPHSGNHQWTEPSTTWSKTGFVAAGHRCGVIASLLRRRVISQTQAATMFLQKVTLKV